MKQICTNYTFNPTLKTIQLTGLNIPQERILLISNSTRGLVYYNFASPTNRANVAFSGGNTVVTLIDAVTSSHAANDKIIIFYDDGKTLQNIGAEIAQGVGDYGALPVFVEGLNPNYGIGHDTGAIAVSSPRISDGYTENFVRIKGAGLKHANGIYKIDANTFPDAGAPLGGVSPVQASYTCISQTSQVLGPNDTYPFNNTPTYNLNQYSRTRLTYQEHNGDYYWFIWYEELIPSDPSYLYKSEEANQLSPVGLTYVDKWGGDYANAIVEAIEEFPVVGTVEIANSSKPIYVQDVAGTAKSFNGFNWDSTGTSPAIEVGQYASIYMFVTANNFSNMTRQIIEWSDEYYPASPQSPPSNTNWVSAPLWKKQENDSRNNGWIAAEFIDDGKEGTNTGTVALYVSPVLGKFFRLKTVAGTASQTALKGFWVTLSKNPITSLPITSNTGDWSVVRLSGVGPVYDGLYKRKPLANPAQGDLRIGLGEWERLATDGSAQGVGTSILKFAAVTGVSGSRWQINDTGSASVICYANSTTTDLSAVPQWIPTNLADSINGETAGVVSHNIKLIPVGGEAVYIANNRPIDISGTVQANVPVASNVNTGSTYQPPNSSTAFVLETNNNRKLFTIYNEGPGVLHVEMGIGTASSSLYFLKMYANDFYESEFKGRMSMVYPSTLGKAKVYELT